jgi:hypothetical protein
MIDTFSFSTQWLGNAISKRCLPSVEQAVHHLTTVATKLGHGLNRAGSDPACSDAQTCGLFLSLGARSDTTLTASIAREHTTQDNLRNRHKGLPTAPVNTRSGPAMRERNVDVQTLGLYNMGFLCSTLDFCSIPYTHDLSITL